MVGYFPFYPHPYPIKSPCLMLKNSTSASFFSHRSFTARRSHRQRAERRTLPRKPEGQRPAGCQERWDFTWSDHSKRIQKVWFHQQNSGQILDIVGTCAWNPRKFTKSSMANKRSFIRTVLPTSRMGFKECDIKWCSWSWGEMDDILYKCLLNMMDELRHPSSCGYWPLANLSIDRGLGIWGGPKVHLDLSSRVCCEGPWANLPFLSHRSVHTPQNHLGWRCELPFTAGFGWDFRKISRVG